MNEEFPSPDNRFLLLLGCNEFRMSLWACSPELRERSTGRVLFSAGSLWDAGSIQWSDDSSTLYFNLRKYPGEPQHDCGVRIRLSDEMAEITRAGKPVQEVKVGALSALFSD